MNWDQIPENVGEANFDDVLAVLRLEVPSRPILFEFFLNERLYRRWTQVCRALIVQFQNGWPG
jgi:hypothetical protein